MCVDGNVKVNKVILVARFTSLRVYCAPYQEEALQERLSGVRPVEGSASQELSLPNS